MGWIEEAIGEDDSFRSVLDGIRESVYKYCDQLENGGAWIEEVHAIAFGFYEAITQDNALQYLYLYYVDDWFAKKGGYE